MNKRTFILSTCNSNATIYFFYYMLKDNCLLKKTTPSIKLNQYNVLSNP